LCPLDCNHTHQQHNRVYPKLLKGGKIGEKEGKRDAQDKK
jgi:hypothetical protein